MTPQDVLEEFRASGALLEGHFLLSSGRHSRHYLQCARVLMNGRRAARLAEALARRLPAELREAVDKVVSPAMGGLIIGHEMGRALDRDAVFLERGGDGFVLRRGFTIAPGERVLLVEDVVTTGLSSREAMAAIAALGGEVVAEAALVDRSGGNADLGVPLHALLNLDVPSYAPDAVPADLAAIPPVKPGSRAQPSAATP
ncbi:orotate phosphoribosyltransferase [Erythrobacteraceae bacterium CFH 75059]|uniref:orotate phosphoribosyltransferase n=1 Tax=Qipengyuania thermophila TaxID=2509361 RepID=UPI00102227DA|nr:orotate phosphoribosyltransferase [Qipengyuania thermophila]TCD04940.1 orotate phosphoribosyltransferase [Erythrobacteraceae bacterium CFH 75059]